MHSTVSVAIIGAGPYGLSIAAHLHEAGVPYAVFGPPMENWATRMPRRMNLKSDGFASDLYAPGAAYRLKEHCEKHGIPYADEGVPVSRELFVDYGREFQKQCAPGLHPVFVKSVTRTSDGYVVVAADGYKATASAVVIATGLSHVEHIPEPLRNLPPERCAHSADVADLSVLKGQRVVVIGAGASATDVAGLAQQEGALVTLVSRTEPQFHTRAEGPRSLWKKVSAPNLGLGPNLRSSLCVALPDVFRMLPTKRRIRIVKRHLGPAGGWFMRDLVVGKVTQVLGELASSRFTGGEVEVTVRTRDGRLQTIAADRVVAATGYQYDMERLTFLEPAIRGSVHTEDGSPHLDRHFQSSVPGLYFVGLPAAVTFGPVQRFALGARFAARRVSSHLARTAPVHSAVEQLPAADSRV